jgi:hypothetical protein
VVADPQAELGKLFDFLGLDGGDADPTVFQRLMLPGRMGRTGIEQYSTVSAEPLDKWRETMGSWYRKRWGRHYLERLGPHRLALMGYDYDRLMREVGELDDSTRGIAFGHGPQRLWARPPGGPPQPDVSGQAGAPDRSSGEAGDGGGADLTCAVGFC